VGVVFLESGCLVEADKLHPIATPEELFTNPKEERTKQLRISCIRWI